MNDEEPGTDRLERIREGLPLYKPQAADFFPITQKNRVVMTAGEVLAIVNEYRRFPFGERRIQITVDELEHRAKNRLRSLAEDAETDADAAEPSDRAEERRLENDFGGALRNIRKYAWINVRHIAQRILGTDHITKAEWLFTMLELTGSRDRNMRYVMIDEVQDYTKAQLEILGMYYPNARFMLLGDEFQSIREGTVSFSEIEEMSREAGKQFVSLPLMTSYRSSPEITELFASLLPQERKLAVLTVRRPGDAVAIKICGSKKEYAGELKKLITQYKKKDGLTAVICRNEESLEEIISVLGKEAPAVVSQHDSLPQKGIFLISLAFAKGLEFDQVILPDVDPENYPDDRISRHCLYTAISRATGRLAILAEKEASPLLYFFKNCS